MSLGLPSFSMIFSGKAVSAIERSARGIVAMILTDGTEGGKDLNIYKKVDEVDFQNWTEQNYNYLKLVFAGAPSTVITIRRAENAEGYNAELKKLKDLKWNYLTIPGLGSTDTTTISAWIKQYRDDERKTFKAVLDTVREIMKESSISQQRISPRPLPAQSILQLSIVRELPGYLQGFPLQEAAHIMYWTIFLKQKLRTIRMIVSMLVRWSLSLMEGSTRLGEA